MGPNTTTKTALQIVSQYFEAFQKSDVEAIVALFAPDATVQSSSGKYQPTDPNIFYQRVFALTQDKVVTVQSIAEDRDNHTIVIVSFSYDWTLKDRSRKNFPYAFDRFEIDPQSSKIKSLIINLGTDILAH